ncbi:MAG: hypothetical protein D6722_01510 [Bacteroidetes bacterium]|nr:MAG: hypothetical protein D6722_01510 [Bacteroidota bacterium]
MNIAALKLNLIKVQRRLRLELSLRWDRLGYRLKALRGQAWPVPAGKKRLLFMCELVPARAGRMAKWLHRLGRYELVLLCHTDGYVAEFVEGHFDRVVRYRNAWHLRSQLERLPDIYLVHSFAPKCEYPDLVRQTVDAPFLLDMQDVIVTYHGLEPPYAWARKELQYERRCLAEADAVIGQSLEPRVGFQRYAIHPRPRTLFFPLYCDDDTWQPLSGPRPDGEIHLVYAGGLAGSHRDRRQFGILQFHPLIELLSAQQIHFHVYPSPSTLPPDYEEYYAIARRNPYFHMHRPVSHGDLTRELAQYDYGFLPFFREDSDLKQEKMTYSTSLKLFNFLEAGLPVVISRDIHYQAWMVMRGGAGIAIGKEDVGTLGARLRATDYPALTARVDRHRRYLALSQQLHRLTRLYDEVVAIHSQSPSV